MSNFFLQTIFVKPKLTHDDVIQFLAKLEKLNCKGSECIDDFFKSGRTPWIGHPTEAFVNSLNNVNIFCYSSNSSAKLKLIAENDEEIVTFQPIELSSKDSIAEAKFTIEDAKDYAGTSFYCSDDYAGTASPNSATALASENQHSEWSDWSTCENVGKDKVSRRRSGNQDSNNVQTRFCRCSDLSNPPSPR